MWGIRIVAGYPVGCRKPTLSRAGVARLHFSEILSRAIFGRLHFKLSFCGGDVFIKGLTVNSEATFCTAKPTSPSVAPGFTTAIAAFNDASVTFTNRAVVGSIFSPTGTVIAASPQ